MTEPDLSDLAEPARRALASIGVTTLGQLADRREAELLALHGFGPKAARTVCEALDAAGLSLCP